MITHQLYTLLNHRHGPLKLHNEETQSKSLTCNNFMNCGI